MQTGAPPPTTFFGPRGSATIGLVSVCLLTLLFNLLVTQRVLAQTDASISVTGIAERRVAPDMAPLSMAVVRDAMQPADARRDADATVARALEMLRSRGIADGDIDSSALEVNPQYRWNDERRERQLTGYRVSRGLTVRLTELDLLGELLVALSELGVNQIQAPRPGLQDPETVYREALAAAAVNARERAEVLAATLDEDLGRVLRVRASDDVSPPVPMRFESARMSADAGEVAVASYQSGDLDFSVHLDVTFALVP